MRNPYLTDVVRGTLTRNIGIKFGEVCEEIREAFQDEIPISDSEGGHSCIEFKC